MLPLIHLISLLAAGAPTPPPPAGEAVIRAAYAMYKGAWFKNVQFIQKTTQLIEGRTETWYVTIQPPGLSRVDVAPGATGRAFIYRNDSSYSYGRGQLRTHAPDIQPLMWLLHDLHTATPERTIGMLRRFGFDLRKSYERMWQGKRVIVVGGTPDDASANQFWMDKKTMVVVRLLEQNASDPKRQLEVRIGQYEKAGNGMLEHQVEIYLGGLLTTREEYSSVAVDGNLEPGIFEPQPYHLPAWVKGAPDIFGGVPNMTLPGNH